MCQRSLFVFFWHQTFRERKVGTNTNLDLYSDKHIGFSPCLNPSRKLKEENRGWGPLWIDEWTICTNVSLCLSVLSSKVNWNLELNELLSVRDTHSGIYISVSCCARLVLTKATGGCGRRQTWQVSRTAFTFCVISSFSLCLSPSHSGCMERRKDTKWGAGIKFGVVALYHLITQNMMIFWTWIKLNVFGKFDGTHQKGFLWLNGYEDKGCQNSFLLTDRLSDFIFQKWKEQI